MFLRENLENNNYFIHRMSMNLEIPLQSIYNERSVKNITQDTNIIINVKKKLRKIKIKRTRWNLKENINKKQFL